MERRDKIIITLLARIAGHLEGLPADEILAAVMDATAPKEKAESPRPDPEVVERIYKVYPTKCPVSGRPLGKCSKNKKQIETLLKTRTPEDIELTIREYIVECKNHGTYLKNFSTFLNQFPERKKPQEQSVQQPQPQPQPQEQPTLPFDAPPTEQPVKKASPEMIAIDAMHKGVTDANLVRNMIVMVWDGITEDKIQHALWNAGYQI